MNLHLMPIYSGFNRNLIVALNTHIPAEENIFVVREPFPGMGSLPNCIADPSRFSVRFINDHAAEYHRIILHYNIFRAHDIMRLSDEAAAKIVWVVWGDDLYYVKRHNAVPKTPRDFARKYFYIWSHYSPLYGIIRHKAKKKVQKFYGIGIGYPYDEVMIHKLYGSEARVVYAPVFSRNNFDYSYEDLRRDHLEGQHDTVNVLIGHSGFPFHNHEKSLRLLSKFKDENIHINLVMSYGANSERVKKIIKLANRLFGEEKTTILTKKLPYSDYCKFLASMDIALFPFTHQAALGNALKLAYAGVKLYLDPSGALAQGFLAGGVKTCDYHHIRKEAWTEFCKCPAPPDKNAPLFENVLNYEKSVASWRSLLS